MYLKKLLKRLFSSSLADELKEPQSLQRGRGNGKLSGDSKVTNYCFNVKHSP